MKNVWIIVQSCEDCDDVYYYVFNSEKKALNALEYFTDGVCDEDEEGDVDIGAIEEFNSLKELIDSAKKNNYNVVESYNCQSIGFY